MRSWMMLALVFLVGCASNGKRSAQTPDVAPRQISSIDGNGQAELDEDLVEIEEIQKMPQGSRDLNESESEVSQIPTEINGLVVKWMNYFQGKGRRYMELYLSRSSRYLPMMKQVLRDRGLPEDLVYIALIESGFSPSARSPVGAVGYWQFMRGTGKDYGLKINSLVDERRDPVLSTQAAGDYFAGLYNLFGSWYLAIASYNTGENKIKRLVMKHQTRDFWELIRRGRLPLETVNYVPKYIAARIIAKNPRKYGFSDIEYREPLSFDEVRVEGPISLTRLASLIDVDYSEMKSLNPAFKTDYALPIRGGSFQLRVPKGKAGVAGQKIAEARVKSTRTLLAASRQGSPQVNHYKVRRGDSLTAVAARFGVGLSQIARANRLSPRANLRVGQTLVIPGSSLSARVRSELKYSAQRKVAKSTSARVHVVRRGETLAGIARRYRVSLREIASLNHFQSRSKIHVGERVVIPD